MTQKLLDEYTDDTPDLFEFDHYGPTMNRPLPKCEETRLAWKMQLRTHGFSPAVLAEEAYTGRDWAHCDVENPDQLELEFEEMAVAFANIREESTDPTEFTQRVPTVEEISEQLNQDNETDETMTNDTTDESTENSTPTHPSNVHTEFSELEELPDEVPIGAGEADIELANRLARAAIREIGHHDPARRELTQWARDHDRETITNAAYEIGVHEFARGSFSGSGEVSTQNKADAVLFWMESEHPDVYQETIREYNDYLRNKCTTALEDQETREKDAEFKANPPNEINGWVRFESEKPDVIVSYRAINHGTPSIATLYETDTGEVDGFEATRSDWNNAETASECGVNRHFVRLTDDSRTVWGDLRNHLRTFDGEPYAAAPMPVEGYDRMMNPKRMGEDDDSELTAIVGFHNPETDHVVGIFHDGEGLFTVGDGDRYDDTEGVSVYRVRQTFCALDTDFSHPERMSGRLDDVSDVREIARQIMEYGSLDDFAESLQESDDDDSNDSEEPEESDESGEETDSNPRYYGIGGGRRKTLDAIDEKDRLEAIETPDTLSELKEAITDISLMQPDGSYYMSPPENPIRTINRVYEDLPDDAKPHYVTDETLVRRVNAARRQFNKWLGRLQREKRMPSPVEAGPANYPAQKARDTARYQHEAYDELKEKIDRIRSGANGARQRALNAVGSSVAEQNEQAAEDLMAQRRENWEPGDIVVYRSPNLHAAAIVRLNEKSVRVQRRNNLQNADFGPDGEFRRETIDLDNEFITVWDPDDLGDIENLDRGQEIPDSLEAAQRQLLGDDWVDEHTTTSDEPDANEPEQQEVGAVATDGGHIEETDPDDPPANETVRLITGITRVMHTPRTFEAETSSSGKTISVTHPVHDETHRLDAEKIFSGECEYRDSTYYEIYTKERFQKRQRANKAPGPRSGTDEVTPKRELPEPTHRPLGESEREQERRERLENEGKEIVTDGGQVVESDEREELKAEIEGQPGVIEFDPEPALGGDEEVRIRAYYFRETATEIMGAYGYEFVHMTGSKQEREAIVWFEKNQDDELELVTDGGQILVACSDPDITRLEYAPHRVDVELSDGEFQPTGSNELLDADWRETDTYWCHGCDTELPSEKAAKRHLDANGVRDAR